VVSVGEGDNEQTYSYDSNGNLIRTTYADGAYMSHTWNYKNQLISTTTRSGETINYRYDHNGMRTYQHNETTGTTKRYYTSGYELETTDDTTTERIPINHMGMHLATIITTNGKTDIHYYHNDHLGTSSIVTNSNNDILDISDTLPYGETRYHDNDEGVTDYFALHEKDTDTGLTYMKARYYSPVMHRFLSIDPWEGDITNPQTLNKYSYSLNNPVNYFDPDGEQPRWGQLGNIDEILSTVGDTQSLRQLTESFNVNAIYSTPAVGESYKETPGNAVKRYIYATKAGWIDMKHFYGSARAYSYFGSFGSEFGGVLTEVMQQVSGDSSAWSYEDTTSNAAGGAFWKEYGRSIRGGNISMQDATRQFLISYGATEPENAPNFDYITHAEWTGERHLQSVEGFLIGDKLRDAHREVFSNYDSKNQDSIKKIHEEIRR